MSTTSFNFDQSFSSLNDGSKPMEKPGFAAGMQPGSLYSMALYSEGADSINYEAGAMGSSSPFSPIRQTSRAASAAFYPVDEFKDMSLPDILSITDDFLLAEDDSFSNMFENNNQNQNNTHHHHDVEPFPMAHSSNHNHNNMMMVTPQQHHQFQPMTPMSGGSFVEAALTIPSNPKKRQREVDFDGEESEEDFRRFRPYQAGQWSEKFTELCEYRTRFGHCLVPHTHTENLPLARWVKRQRYQYKLMQEGKPSTMTEERVKALEEIGFIWDSQGAAWQERLGELTEFRKSFGHTNVPSNYSENCQLATWVKCQRRQYKLYCQGKPSNMTADRVKQLENLGFEWELRTYKRTAP